MGSRERAFTVLIVEDQALIALHIEGVVRRIGASVIGCAARLSDALTLIETASWDAALLDIRLADGETVYPVAERLQAKAVPFAFVTAWEGEIDGRYCNAPVLGKPFGEAVNADSIFPICAEVKFPSWRVPVISRRGDRLLQSLAGGRGGAAVVPGLAH